MPEKNHEQLLEPPANLDELLAAASPELDAFEAATVRRLVSRERALQLTQTLSTSWADELLGELVDELSPARAKQRKAELHGLHARVWVFYAADLRSGERYVDISRAEREALARSVAEHDAFLLKWALPVFGDDPVKSEALRDISMGRGRRDDAEDVLRLVAMFGESWEAVGPQVPLISKAGLAAAEADARRLLELLDSAKENPAKQRVQAAYTLWYRDYWELMSLGRYLRRDHPDARTLFPGVAEPVRRSAPAELAVDEATQAEDEVALEPEDAVAELG